jgi:hypothetical protein
MFHRPILLCTLIIALIVLVIVITHLIKFQFKICFNKVIGFLIKSTSLNTRFVVETHPAVGDFY